MAAVFTPKYISSFPPSFRYWYLSSCHSLITTTSFPGNQTAEPVEISSRLYLISYGGLESEVPTAAID